MGDIWNMLPEEMRESDTVTVFKRQLDCYLNKQGMNTDLGPNTISAEEQNGQHGSAVLKVRFSELAIQLTIKLKVEFQLPLNQIYVLQT